MVDNNKVKKIIFGRIPPTKCGNILFDILFDDYSPSGYFPFVWSTEDNYVSINNFSYTDSDYLILNKYDYVESLYISHNILIKIIKNISILLCLYYIIIHIYLVI